MKLYYSHTHIVMCQVSFNALVTAKSMQLRAKFNRLYTDFVVLDQELNVLAIVELDDKSHRRPDVIEKDITRDKILIDAGYKVIRYKKIPTAELIKHDFGVKQDKHLEPDSVN
ncbi:MULTISPECIES: DUF2726 domain-containing protein [unclassified Acinetobacter]|uniref:DUF2726 domain-containing protein n=1 Tax=unclassified Acinetobacter TaxID=196816 RepID=UPI0015D15416|nr:MULTISPECIES: DUF2726 domain-containing protein [unclassified Acinetobacter]